MRIAGHDFNTDPDTALSCGWCGMLYRDFLRAGGGCVTSGDREPIHVNGDAPAVTETCACRNWAMEPIGPFVNGHHPHCPESKR